MKDLKRVLQRYLRQRVCSFRKQHSLTQEEMAEILHVAPRSYADQERGIYGFSALSFLYFLFLLSDSEILDLLRDLREVLKGGDEDAA